MQNLLLILIIVADFLIDFDSVLKALNEEDVKPKPKRIRIEYDVVHFDIDSKADENYHNKISVLFNKMKNTLYHLNKK